jgi:hypothetical protein
LAKVNIFYFLKMVEIGLIKKFELLKETIFVASFFGPV